MLYLTYNNSLLTDGAGAQLQRMISIYFIAKHFNVKYIHSPLKLLSYQGLSCLEKNENDEKQLIEYNELFNLPSDSLPDNYVIVEETWTTIYKIFHYINEGIKQNILLKLGHANPFVDEFINNLCLDVPFSWIDIHLQKPIIIAVHIRRGELLVVESSRMLPNEYYISCIKALTDILNTNNIKHEFHIHTEQLTKPITVTPSHHGICERIKENITIYPEDNFKELFTNIANVIFHINEYPVKTLQDLTNSDILLASRSSFSYIAAIMKKKGCVLFHPFWHGLSNKWIPTTSDKDIYENAEKILSMIK